MVGYLLLKKKRLPGLLQLLPPTLVLDGDSGVVREGQQSFDILAGYRRVPEEIIYTENPDNPSRSR